MYEEYNNENPGYTEGSGENPENTGYTGGGYSESPSGGDFSQSGADAGADNTDASGSGADADAGADYTNSGYSYHKEDLYEADYVVGDDGASSDQAGRFYENAAGPQEGREEPKWEPNPDKYNSSDSAGGYYTYASSDAPGTAAKKKKKKWWLIPLVAVLVLMVLFICFGVWYGFKYVDQYASSDTDTGETDTDQNTEINISDTSEASTSGIVLTDVSSVVEDVMPAVVSITSRTLVSNSNSFWGYSFGGSTDSSTEEVESGIGSGTIVGTNDTELLILTSYHVVEDSSSLYVTFCDDEAVDGYIKSSSEEYDIAVVAVPLEDISESTMESITIATLCTEQASVGEGVIVIGDALGYGQSVTTGIVSAVDREITVEDRTITVLQTDAAINSGNSGGCVLNSAGQVIGISEAKISSDNVEGMCYAISVNCYAELIEELLTTTTESSTDTDTSDSFVSSSQTAYLGIQGYEIDSDTAQSYNMVEGVYVLTVTSGGGAEAAGVQEGDIIVELDGTTITTMSGLQSLLTQYSPGDTVSLTVMRSSGNGYSSVTLQVTLTAAIS